MNVSAASHVDTHRPRDHILKKSDSIFATFSERNPGPGQRPKLM